MSPPDERDVDRACAAFPRECGEDVAVVMSRVPNSSTDMVTGSLFHSSIDSDRKPVGVVASGEAVDIPSRFYGSELDPQDITALTSARQRTVLACLYSRHHDGHVRQRWAAELVATTEPLVVPFVVQLVGEYVVQIVEDLDRGLADLDDPAAERGALFRTFVASNPGFMGLTRQRAASYWAEYHVRRYCRRAEYPAFRILRRMSLLTRG